ncbi:MAG: putative cation transporter, periplasmic cation-binding protein [Rickettsiaceae bacterium]|jgi:zinc transport system substrate-binding protein|nr:putative cation transporter, periplasmic cation-binding protein [Rickettsiaceae bacterium]
MNNFLRILLFCLICTKQSFADQALKIPPKIASSINPVYQIAKFISGREEDNSLLLNVNLPVLGYNFRSSGEFGHLANIDVVFYISDELEANLSGDFFVLQKRPKIVQLIKAKNIKLITTTTRFGGNDDLYIWMDPQNAIAMASEIADILSDLYPPSANIYKKNLERFKEDIKTMDQKNIAALAGVNPKSFIFDQNVTAYFERYYNLPAAAVIRNRPDEVLSQRYMDEIDGLVKQKNISCIASGFRERNIEALYLAQTNGIKFSMIDVMGSGSFSGLGSKENGYVKMISDFVRDLAGCAKYQGCAPKISDDGDLYDYEKQNTTCMLPIKAK